jgi:glutathione S-transferase
MMKLLGSPLSPYVRKALITAELKGLAGRIELIPADTNKGDETLFQKNPLGKIPCLLTEDGQSIFDSHVVCEYLDSLAPSPVLFPRSGPERWRTLTLGALGDGILDAALLLVYETRFRPEGMAVQGWIDRQQAKIDRSVDLLRSPRLPWVRLRTTDTSRSPPRSATWISVTMAAGARRIRRWSPGSTRSPDRCRHSRRPARLADGTGQAEQGRCHFARQFRKRSRE